MGSYLKGFFVKCLENLSSAKMWMFVLPFLASSAFMGYFLYSAVGMIKTTLDAAGVSPAEMANVIKQLKMIGDVFIAWCTFNVSLASVIIAVREIFKVKKLKALSTEEAAKINP